MRDRLEMALVVIVALLAASVVVAAIVAIQGSRTAKCEAILALAPTAADSVAVRVSAHCGKWLDAPGARRGGGG